MSTVARSEFHIRGLTLVRRRSPALPRVVAFFDVDVLGIEICGCSLIRTTNDGLTVKPPRLQGDRPYQDTPFAGVRFEGQQTHSEIKMAVRRAYLAMGGDDLPE